MSLARVKPNPENCSLAGLEMAMHAARSGRSSDRMRAIRALLLGQREEDVALIFEITDRTLERWVGRFNRCGIDGLLDRPRPGAPRKITDQASAHYRELIDNPQRVGQAHWTALEFSHSDSVVFQTFLDHANADVALRRSRNLLICDNASWHKNKTIEWGKFEPAFLPAYSPDLNPIERLWLLMKAEWFCDFIAKDRTQLMARLDQALNWITGRAPDNRRTCAIAT